MSEKSDVFLAGAIAAFTVDFMIYPLDTIKTRLQTTPGDSLNRIKYRGLYQGITPIILATIPSSCAFFGTYEHLHRLLPHHPLSSALASSIAESVSCAILTPFEVLKQRTQNVVGARTLDIFLSSIRKGGVFSLWSGYFALVARNLPFTAIQFPVFEHLKKRWGVGTGGARGGVGDGEKQSGNEQDYGIGKTLLWAGCAAGTAGAVGAVVTQPLDAVKTAVMVRGGGSWGGVIKELGWRGVWRGGAVRVVWTAVGSGTYLGAYEGGKVGLRGWREGRSVKELAA